MEQGWGMNEAGRMSSMLEISRELAAIAQAGMAYSQDGFDRERFWRVRVLASEMLRVQGVAEFDWPAELGYATPKVDVRGVVFHGEEVLLMRERSSGLWTAPGGWADVNLSPRENVEKECKEETGYDVQAVVLVSVLDRDRAGYPRNAHSIYKMVFLCTLLGGEATTGIETSEVGFFPVTELPPLDPHRIRAVDIAEAYRVYKGDGERTGFN